MVNKKLLFYLIMPIEKRDQMDHLLDVCESWLLVFHARPYTHTHNLCRKCTQMMRLNSEIFSCIMACDEDRSDCLFLLKRGEWKSKQANQPFENTKKKKRAQFHCEQFVDGMRARVESRSQIVDEPTCGACVRLCKTASRLSRTINHSILQLFDANWIDYRPEQMIRAEQKKDLRSWRQPMNKKKYGHRWCFEKCFFFPFDYDVNFHFQ